VWTVKYNENIICFTGVETALKAELEAARQALSTLEAQAAAEAAARTAAIAQAQEMADKAKLLESQVEALNRAAAEATQRLQSSLKEMEASHAVLAVPV
jgi:erythromycin esterase-like protein